METKIVDSNVFFRLDRFWKEMFKDPKEVALGAQYLPNLLRPAVGAFSSYRRDNRSNDDAQLTGDAEHDADVAVRLLRDALHNDPVIDLLRWEAPEKVARLEELLAENVVDASELPMALRRLGAILSSEDLVRRAMAAQLGAGEAADLKILQGAAVVLACRNVGRFSESQMKTLLKRSFARAVALAILEEHTDRIRGNTEVTSELEALEERVVHAATVDEGSGSGNTGDGDLFALFGGGPGWRRSAYRLIALTRRLCAAKLGEHVCGQGEEGFSLEDAVARLAEDRETQERMAREVVARYAAYALRERFQRVIEGEGRLADPILAHASEAMERTLGRVGLSEWPARFKEDPESFPPNSTRSASALSAALPIALSEACAAGYTAANQDQIARVSAQLGERLVGLLMEEVRTSEPSSSDDETVGSAEELCARWAARRRLHRMAGEVLSELDSSLQSYLRDLPARNPLANVTVRDRFWRPWRRNYAGEAFYSSEIPWDAVEKGRVLERAVSDTMSRFGGSRADHLVVFRVEGIRPDGMSWPMADVTFYDPELFDYGEGPELPQATDDSLAVSHAAVRVTADTPAEAVRSARQRLVAGLDCYSFGLSGNSLRPDFNPRVRDGEYVVNLSEEWGSFNYQRELPFQDEQRAEDLDLPRMARAYASLLTTAARDPRRMTQLQDRFLRAVHWLREARFEADPAKRFILHYVGMEHIFSRGEASDAVARRAPKLNKTWRNIGRRLMYPNMTFNRFHELVRGDTEVRELADADERLQNWDRDERVFLHPERVRFLLDQIPADREEVRRSASMLIEELESLRADSEIITAHVEQMRDLQIVKVRQLQMLRNTVVHDALYQDERMRYYAQEAYEILHSALNKMVREVTCQDSDCKTIDQLIEKHDGQPWLR